VRGIAIILAALGILAASAPHGFADPGYIFRYKGMFSGASGTPALAASLGASPASLGNLHVTGPATPSFGTPGAATFTNGGGAATGPLATSLTGSDFEVTSDTCSGSPLAPAQSCTVGVRGRASADGPLSGSLRVGDGTSSATVALSGTASGFVPDASEVTPVSVTPLTPVYMHGVAVEIDYGRPVRFDRIIVSGNAGTITSQNQSMYPTWTHARKHAYRYASVFDGASWTTPVVSPTPPFEQQTQISRPFAVTLNEDFTISSYAGAPVVGTRIQIQVYDECSLFQYSYGGSSTSCFYNMTGRNAGVRFSPTGTIFR